MKNLLILAILFLLSGCTEFKMGQVVKINRGFYKGCTGQVINKSFNSYLVDLKCINNTSTIYTSNWIGSGDLE